MAGRGLAQSRVPPLPPPPTAQAFPAVPHDASPIKAANDAGAPRSVQPAFNVPPVKETETNAVFRRQQPEDVFGVIPAGGYKPKAGDDELDFNVVTELPGPNRLFERFSEAQVQEVIRQAAKRRPGSGRVVFPEYPPLTRETHVPPRAYGKMIEPVEPNCVCHGRLYFEQKNFERQGWDLGVFAPAVSVGIFYYYLALLPYHYWTRPCDRYDCSAGKCLPGDCLPLYLYPEEFSLTGLAGEASVLGLGFLAFP